MKPLGDNTRMYRAEFYDFKLSHGLTVNEIANYLGVHKRTVFRWLRGSHPVPPPAALLLRSMKETTKDS